MTIKVSHYKKYTKHKNKDRDKDKQKQKQTYKKSGKTHKNTNKLNLYGGFKVPRVKTYKARKTRSYNSGNEIVGQGQGQQGSSSGKKPKRSYLYHVSKAFGKFAPPKLRKRYKEYKFTTKNGKIKIPKMGSSTTNNVTPPDTPPDTPPQSPLSNEEAKKLLARTLGGPDNNNEGYSEGYGEGYGKGPENTEKGKKYEGEKYDASNGNGKRKLPPSQEKSIQSFKKDAQGLSAETETDTQNKSIGTKNKSIDTKNKSIGTNKKLLNTQNSSNYGGLTFEEYVKSQRKKNKAEYAEMRFEYKKNNQEPLYPRDSNNPNDRLSGQRGTSEYNEIVHDPKGNYTIPVEQKNNYEGIEFIQNDSQQEYEDYKKQKPPEYGTLELVQGVSNRKPNLNKEKPLYFDPSVPGAKKENREEPTQPKPEYASINFVPPVNNKSYYNKFQFINNGPNYTPPPPPGFANPNYNLAVLNKPLHASAKLSTSGVENPTYSSAQSTLSKPPPNTYFNVTLKSTVVGGVSNPTYVEANKLALALASKNKSSSVSSFDGVSNPTYANATQLALALASKNKSSSVSSFGGVSNPSYISTATGNAYVSNIPVYAVATPVGTPVAPAIEKRPPPPPNTYLDVKSTNVPVYLNTSTGVLKPKPPVYLDPSSKLNTNFNVTPQSKVAGSVRNPTYVEANQLALATQSNSFSGVSNPGYVTGNTSESYNYANAKSKKHIGINNPGYSKSNGTSNAHAEVNTSQNKKPTNNILYAVANLVRRNTQPPPPPPPKAPPPAPAAVEPPPPAAVAEPAAPTELATVVLQTLRDLKPHENSTNTGERLRHVPIKKVTGTQPKPHSEPTTVQQALKSVVSKIAAQEIKQKPLLTINQIPTKLLASKIIYKDNETSTPNDLPIATEPPTAIPTPTAPANSTNTN